jgi:hypothetical protein
VDVDTTPGEVDVGPPPDDGEFDPAPPSDEDVEALPLGEADVEDGLAGDDETTVGDGWRITGCTAATGWFGGPGRFVTVEASAALAATAKTAAPPTTATLAAPKCRGLMRQRGVLGLGVVLVSSGTW